MSQLDARLLDYLTTHKDRMLEELFDLLRIPSISTDPTAKNDIQTCATWIQNHLKKIGFETVEVYETPGHPIVYAEYLPKKDAPTYLLYGHYDVQPPDPLELWKSPPFEPEVRDGKIFARGATDDKGQFFCHIKALETYFSLFQTLPVNLKIIIEGEEEIGSPNLESWVHEHKELLAANAVVISDSSMYAPGQPSICYGLRGLSYFEIEVEGPDHDLHSGLFGGSVENPINALCSIISQLKNEDGQITVPGFYDNVCPLTQEERDNFAQLPFDKKEYLEKTGAKDLHGEKSFTTLERIWARPTLDCNGIIGGFTGEGAKTVLPSKAKAKFSCRLVPDQDFHEIEEKVMTYIKQITPDYLRVNISFHHGGNPVLIDRNHQVMNAASRALEASWKRKPFFIREGGSIPVVTTFSNVLNCPTVLLGLGLTDDCLHSPNEKFNLENFYGGIRTSLYLWHELEQLHKETK